jgi:uncharacterized protein involved in exopolysaccharide biosynthesis
MPPVYKAVAKVLIRQDIKIYPDELVSVDRPEAYLTTQKEILSSRIVVDEALRILAAKGIMKNASYEDVKDGISVIYLNDSDILAVQAKAKAPRDAAEFANALVEAFIAYHQNQQVAFVDTNLAAIENELRAIESDIGSMKKRISSVSGPEGVDLYMRQVPLYVEKMLSVSETCRQTEYDLARLKDQLRRTNDILNKGTDGIFFPLVPGTSRAADENPAASLSAVPWIRDVKARMAEVQSKFAAVNAEYTETSPEVLELSLQMDGLKEQLNSELSEVYSAYADYYGRSISALESRRQENENARQAYQQKLDDIKARIQEASSDQVEQMMLIRNYEAVEKVQAALLKKQKELQYLKGQITLASIPNIRVFEQAYVPRKPASPNLALNLALGAFLGLFIGFLGAIMSSSAPGAGYAELPGSSRVSVERRRMKRIERDFDVSFSVGEESKYALLGASAANVSPAGINLKLKKVLPVGTDLHLEIRTGANESVRASGRIVWSDTGRTMPYSTGIAFTRIEAQEREKLIRSIYGEESGIFA